MGAVPGAVEQASKVLDCPQHLVGRVIGKGGETIRDLQLRSRYALVVVVVVVVVVVLVVVLAVVLVFIRLMYGCKQGKDPDRPIGT